MKFNEMIYERPDLDKIREELSFLFEKLKQQDDAEGFWNVFQEISQIRTHVYTMSVLSEVRHTIDTSDSFYSEENDFWDENNPHIEELNDQLYEICLDCPFREELYAYIPETFFQLAECSRKSFSKEIIPLLTEENKLASAYSKLKASAKIPFEGEILNLSQIAAKGVSPDRETRKKAGEACAGFYRENEAEFDRIFDELVKVRTQIAGMLGFDSFTPLGYLRMSRLDYDAEMVSRYREGVRKYIVPLVSELFEKQRVRLGYDRLNYYDLDHHFPTGNPVPEGSADDLVEAARKMYREMSPETGEFFDMMADNCLFDLVSKPNKDTGGYMTPIPEYKVPFIFSNFNGTSGDVDVLTHEAGHAFQYYLAKDIPVFEVSSPTAESCEIHSMSMEFFAYPWLRYFFGKQEKKYKYSHLAGTLAFLPYGVLVDHFQHEIYANPQWTPEERKACWRKLEKTYMPYKDYTESEILEKGCWWFRQLHIFQVPFYYIDYTLAQVCAQQFHIRSVQGDPDCWQDYLHLCRLGGTMTFTKLLEACHLRNPFDESVIADISSALKKELDSFSEADLV